jgi:RNase adaptor protein for sRNA GlmZ degradation
MLEMTIKELESSNKKQVENFEASLRQMSGQLQEQQNIMHTLKTENNSLKVFTNQLKQTVESQKASYENLRNQLASVYKEQQRESK